MDYGLRTKHMKRILFFVFAVLLSFPLLAQERSAADRAKSKANRFAKEWQLEPRQRDNVYAVYLTQEKKTEEIAHLEATDADAFRAQRKAIRAEAEEKLILSLDKYQRRDYKKAKSGKKKKKRKKRRRQFG